MDSSSILDKWRRKFYFCVGKETGKSIEEKLQIDSSKIIGKECGNALELAKNIISFFQISCEKKQDQEINLLFLCGNLRRNDLIEVLEKENQILNFTKFKITELVSYQTKISSNLNSNSEQSNQSPLLTIINQSNPTWFIFFSPSGVEAIASQLTTEEKLKILSTIKFAAIGATTGKAIKSHFGINQIAIASKPSPPALFEAITNSLS